MEFSRRTLIKGALAAGAAALLLPATDLITDAEEVTRRYYQLDRTMLAPRANWQLLGTERRWGAQRTLTMSGPLPASLRAGEVVDIWGRAEGREQGYRAVVNSIARMPDYFKANAAPVWQVRVTPVSRGVRPAMHRDAIGEWRYVSEVRPVPVSSTIDVQARARRLR